MPKRNNTIGVTEGLLPLLDVAILLLGFFIILLASGASSQNPAPTEASVPGIGQVILLRVVAENEMYISGGGDTKSIQVSDVEKLSSELNKLKKQGIKDEPIVLCYYKDPWRDFPPDFDTKLINAVRLAACRYARTYP